MAGLETGPEKVTPSIVSIQAFVTMTTSEALYRKTVRQKLFFVICYLFLRIT